MSGRLLPVRRPLWLVAVALAVGTALAHAAWLGWDQEYQRDPVTGASTGPYAAWQVVGCVLTLVALAAAAGLVRRPGAAVAVPVVFTAAWSLEAAARDDGGLWLVGAVLVLAGTLGGAAAVAAVADAAARRSSRAG